MTKIKHGVNFVGFLIIIFIIFQCTTYLFRGTGYDHWRIANIREEQDLDVICIGGSSLLTYWQAVRAWNDYGFTSCSYATNNLPIEAPEYLMGYGLEYHQPELWVIEMRSFMFYKNEIVEGGLRNSADAMNVTSPIRYKYIYTYLKNRPWPEDIDILSYYLDIIYYHENYWNLHNENSWKNLFNTYYDHVYQNEGWEWRDNWCNVEKPEGFDTDKEAILDTYVEQTLKSLLEYCKQNNQNVLFVATPFETNKEYKMMCNTYKRMIESYGYEFIDGNMFYDEMGIDFSMDFSDPSHVNLFGAEKFTRFLSEYIVTHYDLPDHRGDAEYNVWDGYYQKFLSEEKEHQQIVRDMMILEE